MLLLIPLLLTQPELMGPHAIESMDAGSVLADGVDIPVMLYAPTGPGAYPVVGVMHGYSRTGRFMRVMAETLASHGFVAVVPNMPCSIIGGCDHDANGRQLRDLLTWAASASPYADRIDGERRGLIGHSWGGLGGHVATALDPNVDVVVALDPNEDGAAGFDAAPAILVPNAHIMAEFAGACNGDWGTTVFPRTIGPRLRVRVVGSGHCDVEEPTDGLCPIACGQGDSSTTPLFRRYAIGFVQCVLTGEGSVSDLIAADGNAIDSVEHDRLDTLPCETLAPTKDGGFQDDGIRDASMPEKDAQAQDSMSPDAVALDDGVLDGGEKPVPDADPTDVGALDFRTDPVPSDPPSSCGCRSVSSGATGGTAGSNGSYGLDGTDTWGLGFLFVLGIGVWRRRLRY